MIIMKKAYIFISLIACIADLSCSKNLNLSPQDQISDATFWKTSADYELAANSFYSSLEGANYDDNESDIAYGVAPNSISDGSYIAPVSSTLWTNAYSTIRACNYLIQQAESGTTKDNVSRWVGEAYFFRAYNYWLLFKSFGGVPLITKVLNVNSPELYGARSSRDSTVDLILSDLDSASAKLPLENQLAPNEIGRVTKGAADALAARVALFEGTWNEFRDIGNPDNYLNIAILKSRTVMESGQYSLFNSMGSESYRDLFINEGINNPEDILVTRYRANIFTTDFVWYATYGYMAPTKALADMYRCTDGLPINQSPLFKGYSTDSSEFMNRDPRMTMTFIVPGRSILEPGYPTTPVTCYPGTGSNRNVNTGYMLYKFVSDDDVYGNSTWAENSLDWPEIRYAEVLLIYAESTFEENGYISDADLNISINLLRSRVGMPPLTNEFVRTHGLDMRTEIRNERTVELAFEGFRYDDLRRWKTAERILPESVLGVQISGSSWANMTPYSSGQFPVNSDGYLIAEPSSKRSFDPNKNYLLPIPTKEVSQNPKLVQNPGW